MSWSAAPVIDWMMHRGRHLSTREEVVGGICERVREAGLPIDRVAFFLWIGIFSLVVIAQFWAFANDVYTVEQGKRLFAIVGFGFGASFVALFAQLGGGIYTKAADVGADLVGKVEQSMAEDDPRNAATIADNVGDNVGDCAGMAADLFESYEVTLVASIILGAAAFAGSPEGAIVGVMFPLLVRAIGVVTSIIGIYSVRPRSETEHGMRAINRGFFISALVSALAVYFVAELYVNDLRVFWAVVIGLVPCLMAVESFTVERLYLLVFLQSIASALFLPALTASVPILVGPRQFTAANALLQITTGLGVIIGPALSGLGIAALPAGTDTGGVFALDGGLPGRTVLLHGEQGLGDTIQFIRYAPLVAQRGARVVALSMPVVVGLTMSFESYSPIFHLPGWGAVLERPPAERMAALRDPATRRRLDSSTLVA